MRSLKFIYFILLFASCNSSNNKEGANTTNEHLAKPKMSVQNSDSVNHVLALYDTISPNQKNNNGNKKASKTTYERFGCMLVLNGKPSRYDLNLPEKIYNLKSDTISMILNRFYKQNEPMFPTSIACNFEKGTSTVNIIYPTVNFKVYLFENEYAEKPYKIVDYSIYSESDQRKIDAITYSKIEPIYHWNTLSGWGKQSPTISPDNQDLGIYLTNHAITPEKVKQMGLSGASWLTFIVEKDGSLSDIKIEKEYPGCQECDDEALREAKSLPILNPGTIDGIPVRVSVHQGINFPNMYTHK